MPGLWGSCLAFRRRKDRKGEETEEVGRTRQGSVAEGERRASSYDGKGVEAAEAQGGDTVAMPKWEERGTTPGDEQITKPMPVRVHLRRPSSMALGYKVGLVYDERMQSHYNVEDPLHPETPERISAIYEALQSAGIVDKCELVEAREATTAELACVHGKKHIESMRTVSKRAQDRAARVSLARKYNSIYFNDGSTMSALLAAGSCVEVAIKVARGELGAGAALVRPPGHHAEPDTAMGFCLFNNVAVAAHHIVHGHPSLGIKKVLIVDWDVHHGNGTQHIFWKDPFVLYFSIHRYDYGYFYPTGDDGDFDKLGEGAGKGFNVNIPWQRLGYGDLDYLAVFDHVLIPIAQEFNPDMVFISGGFDSALGDPLGGCKVTPAGYFQMTQRLMALAGGRVVLALEGGYNLNSIAKSYLACMKALLGESCEDKVSLDLRSSTWSLIREVRKKLLPFWSSLSKVLPDNPPEHFDVAEDEGLDSAYQDSVSVSEEGSGDERDVGANKELVVERALPEEKEHPGDLLTQLKSLEEARLSSMQRSDVESLMGGISRLTVKGEGESTDGGGPDKDPPRVSTNWEDLLDETSKHYRDS